MARLKTDFWASAHLRLCALEGIDAVLRRRGAAEAGAVFVSLDRLAGACDLYGPAPQSWLQDDHDGRRFVPVLEGVTVLDIESRMKREISFDPDLWWLSIDDRAGRTLLEMAPPDA